MLHQNLCVRQVDSGRAVSLRSRVPPRSFSRCSSTSCLGGETTPEEEIPQDMVTDRQAESPTARARVFCEEADLDVVGEAANGKQAVESTRQLQPM